MEVSKILSAISPNATIIGFYPKQVGVGCWHIQISPSEGDDFLLATQHPTSEAAKQQIKELKLAFKLGEKMYARAIMKKVKSKI